MLQNPELFLSHESALSLQKRPRTTAVLSGNDLPFSYWTTKPSQALVISGYPWARRHVRQQLRIAEHFI